MDQKNCRSKALAAVRLAFVIAAPAVATLQAQPPFDARAIVGWHQAGASSADFKQNLFFDFYVARPLGNGPVHANKVSMWGQVRIASAPQQKSIPVSQFAAQFASQLGDVKVNELAQSGEFLVGFEVKPWRTWSDADRHRALGLVAFFGGNGAFTDPTTNPRIFRAIPESAPQFANFVTNFPEFKEANFRAKAQFVGLVPPDRERFYRQYGAGLRYTSYDATAPALSPAMFTASIGQDQMITAGRYVGPVFKVDAFYPLKIKDTSFVYLFGTANLAIKKPFNNTPLGMQLVSQPCEPAKDNPASGSLCDVRIYQDNVAVYAIPSSRDTYRFGIGIDFIGLIRKWLP